MRQRGGVGDVPGPGVHPGLGPRVRADPRTPATPAAPPTPISIYPHKAIIAYLAQTHRLLNEYCVTFPDETRPYGSARLPDSDDVLAKWMALTGDEQRLISTANMHLPGRQLDPTRVKRDLWRLSQWERARMRDAARAAGKPRWPPEPRHDAADRRGGLTAGRAPRSPPPTAAASGAVMRVDGRSSSHSAGLSPIARVCNDTCIYEVLTSAAHGPGATATILAQVATFSPLKPPSEPRRFQSPLSGAHDQPRGRQAAPSLDAAGRDRAGRPRRARRARGRVDVGKGEHRAADATLAKVGMPLGGGKIVSVSVIGGREQKLVPVKVVGDRDRRPPAGAGRTSRSRSGSSSSGRAGSRGCRARPRR